MIRGVAQFGSAPGSGPGGRGFESRHSDQKRTCFCRSFFNKNYLKKVIDTYQHLFKFPSYKKNIAITNQYFSIKLFTYPFRQKNRKKSTRTAKKH